MEAVSPLVTMTGISKRYGGVHACDDVSFTLAAGEVHALLGENGAGKSTLMRVLSGDITDYDGQIRIEDTPVRFAGPAAAQAAGIAMIHQELDLVPGLTIAANIFLGREPRTRLGTVDRRRIDRETRSLLRRTGLELDPNRLVGELRVGEQQLVTIAKALRLNARTLIMDEPTSALSTAEVDRLFAVIDELRRNGAGIVYISHRMDEIGRIADRASVLRNGRNVTTFQARSMSAAQAAEAMVGQPVQSLFQVDDAESGEVLLRLEDFALRPRRPRPGRRDPAGISLTVRRGEIVGLAGLLGSGRTELLEALFGEGPRGTWSGQVLLDGTPVRFRGARAALRHGVAFVPEDRRSAGLVLEHSILANTVLSSLPDLGSAGLVSRRRERTAARSEADRLRVKLASLADAVSSLSGGNQQKVVFGRMLLTGPRLLLLDEPTRGIDINAKAEIYRILGDLARAGLAVLVASSELPELIGVCNRVVVLRGGRSVAQLPTAGASEADLLAAAMGEGVPATDAALPQSSGGTT